MDIMRFVQSIFTGIARRYATRAVMKGIDHFASGGKTAAEQTPAEQEQSRKARELTKRARQAARLTRKIR